MTIQLRTDKRRANRKKFLDLTGARYLRRIQQDLPINPLIHAPNPTVNAKEPYEVASMIRAFAPQLGTLQERAIANAYRRRISAGLSRPEPQPASSTWAGTGRVATNGP